VLATTTNGSDVETAVRQYLQSVMSNASDPDAVRVTVPTSISTATSGSSLTVAVEVDYADVTRVPLGYLGLNPTISATQFGLRK
jgi:hypothetical protein